MARNKNKDMLSTLTRETYEKDSETIKYYRNNPIQACRDLLGIELL